MTLEEAKEKIQNLVAVQCANGNWNANDYMHGMANGMLLIQSVIEETEPNFFDAPDMYLDSADLIDKLRKAGIILE